MKPILFSTPMVQAILDGRKTMTRRVINNRDILKLLLYGQGDGYIDEMLTGNLDMAQYKVGDVLWVRETWNCIPVHDGLSHSIEERQANKTVGVIGYDYWYKADDRDDNSDNKWRPSIFMPREAARIFLRVKAVRAERVQEITEADAIAEGISTLRELQGLETIGRGPRENYAKHLFCETWDSLNAKRGYGWGKNPFVWVIEFERIDKADLRAAMERETHER
jgi:hypothetical protein